MARATRDDSLIERDVRAQVRWAVGTRSAHLELTVRGGQVTLSGWLPSPAKRSEVGEAVRCVPGVAGVVNDILVRAVLSGA